MENIFSNFCSNTVHTEIFQREVGPYEVVLWLQRSQMFIDHSTGIFGAQAERDVSELEYSRQSYVSLRWSLKWFLHPHFYKHFVPMGRGQLL
jgi:hypothetical protein